MIFHSSPLSIDREGLGVTMTFLRDTCHTLATACEMSQLPQKCDNGEILSSTGL